MSVSVMTDDDEVSPPPPPPIRSITNVGTDCSVGEGDNDEAGDLTEASGRIVTNKTGATIPEGLPAG